MLDSWLWWKKSLKQGPIGGVRVLVKLIKALVIIKISGFPQDVLAAALLE